MSTTAWIVLGVVVVALVWAVAVYNRLVQLRNRIANAFGQIDVQLKRRYDLIPNLVEVARGYLAHEAATLEAVIKARGQAQGAAAAVRASPESASAMGALAAAEGVLGGSLGRLMVVAEAYPDLKADATMQSLSEELTSTENRLGFARQAYNDQALEFNDKAAQFPDLIVARLLGFPTVPMLESTQNDEERAAPMVKF
ncbi:MAG: LemA family protein [Gammaproteobacteria bacterium]|jgi:LemA protein|nr:LemA family protein [Gammaproteobacteria bacterium]MBU1504702.1 LemA family protein [Gammaproteobacteria bacterium]MBU2122587.1 LemA family protein [Gammaproteobacteria bacterium]MBU2171452.1 LemA family protein [Gammaproteobacteria bacterium]MBU2198999.1 LemA family protein [Gammaproteobacteria bacterium]